MGLDVRLPLGLMFVTIGLLLAGYGALAADAAGAGLNIGWGLVLLAVGALLLWLGRRAARSRPPNT
ncbi:MAG TPA: hypothetical protein VJQ52_06450 [Steroidobacteraceae bacterium]|nr:hypothetical protein [Steroidobacteraceae bacterium]